MICHLKQWLRKLYCEDQQLFCDLSSLNIKIKESVAILKKEWLQRKNLSSKGVMKSTITDGDQDVVYDTDEEVKDAEYGSLEGTKYFLQIQEKQVY